MPLRQRSLAPEEMDRPDLPAAAHNQALRGLSRLNLWSGSDRILWRPIAALASQIPNRPLRLLDVACGAGDILVRLGRRAAKCGVALDLHGIDVSATALAHAQARCGLAGVTAGFERRDALIEPLPTGFDVVTCSLFLHHLTDDQAVTLLKRMASATGRLALVNDLRRTRRGWLLAAAACRLLSRSPIVRVDGPRSVARAFTPAEARALAARAGLANAVISRRWPFRFLLTWDRAFA